MPFVSVYMEQLYALGNVTKTKTTPHTS